MKLTARFVMIALCGASTANFALTATSASAQSYTAVFNDPGAKVSDTFVINPTSPGNYVVPGYDFAPLDSGGQSATFSNTAAFQKDYGKPYNFQFYDANTGFDGLYTGNQLYTGSESDPVFQTGTFNLTGSSDFGSNGGPIATISFSPIGSAAVPEPTTWALMLSGFGMMGGMLRRRQRPFIGLSPAYAK